MKKIEEMKQHEWSISWSGGKDSTATVILCHEYGIPIKEIIYVRMMYDEELPATLPVMTDFVDNAVKVFENWLTEETIKVFDSEGERQEWLNDNCISFSDGNYIDGTEIKISIYESRYNY